MSKNLAVFGCSWSFGMPDIGTQPAKPRSSRQGRYLHDCWPLRFARQNPEYTVYNFSRGGTGIGFHIALLHQFLNSDLYTDDTKIVFQITAPYRYTYNVEERLALKPNWSIVDNYQLFDKEWKQKTIKPNNFQNKDELLLDGYSQDQIEFYNSYMKHYPDRYTYIEFESQIAYVKCICDFVYAHQYFLESFIDNREAHIQLQHVKQKYNTIPVVRDILGEETFKNFVADNGAHFGDEGLDYMAKWIKGKLNV
jgi:hypothetical protein